MIEPTVTHELRLSWAAPEAPWRTPTRLMPPSPRTPPPAASWTYGCAAWPEGPRDPGAYTGLTLTATYAGGGGGDPFLTNGQAITISGAAGSTQYWRVNTPAGKTLTISMSGGTGDADLYTRFGSRPTTSTYLCRPYKAGNAETCTVTSTSAGDYYIMVRGYSAFSGVSLKASY